MKEIFELSDFTKRVLLVLDGLKESKKVKSDRQFAFTVGIDPTQVSFARQQKRDIPEKYLFDISEKYEVNREFLRNGSGKIYTNNDNVNLSKKSEFDLNDKKPVNHNLTYTENSTFPDGKIPRGKIAEGESIPMYNVPASASMLEMYADVNDVKVVGHLSIPGAVKGSFALPVHGHSMYPTLANGSWGIVRPITDRQDIEWGNIYYIEYGDYRVWKRLIKDDERPDSVILYSDNDKELVGGKPKYAAKTIKAERISRLCLLTDILIKPNY